MEFGKHLGKGMWGLGGRALPSIYGVGIIVFVIRIFPPVEFGVYTILQTVLMLVLGTGQSFALLPLVKIAAENDEISGPLSASVILYALFVIPVAVVILLAGGPLGVVLQSDSAGRLMYFIPLMLIASFPRNVASYLLQSKLELKRLFFLDAIYSLGSLLLVALLVSGGAVDSAEGLMRINLLTILLSSVYGVVIVATRYPARFIFRRTDVSRMWNYGRYTLGSSIAYTLYIQSDSLIISATLGPISVAVYNAAKAFARVFEMAMQVIALLMVPVVSRFHARGENDALKTLAEKSLFVSSSALILVSGFLFLAGPMLMDLIYGDKYRDAVPLLRILAVSGIFIGGIAVSSSICYGLGKIREVFYINSLTSAAGICMVALMTAGFGLRGSAWAAVICSGTMMTVWLWALGTRTGIPLTPGGVLRRYSDPVNFIRKRLMGLP